MRTWVLLAAASLATLWLFGSTAYADEFKAKSETKTAGAVQVEFITQAEGTIVGESHIAVQLKESATGRPIVRDSVRVELTMDEEDKSMSHVDMSKQVPVVADLKASHDVPGKYSGKVNFTDAGNWKARVFVDANGVQSPVTFGMRVEGNGPNWLVIGGFVVILALVVGGAAAMKRKAPIAPPVKKTVEPVQS